MNIVYDIRLDCPLCPKCSGPAHWDDDGNLQCEWAECSFLYVMFSDENQGFQMELNFS